MTVRVRAGRPIYCYFTEQHPRRARRMSGRLGWPNFTEKSAQLLEKCLALLNDLKMSLPCCRVCKFACAPVVNLFIEYLTPERAGCKWTSGKSTVSGNTGSYYTIYASGGDAMAAAREVHGY